MTIYLTRAGGNGELSIPEAIQKRAGIKPDQVVTVVYLDGSVIISPLSPEFVEFLDPIGPGGREMSWHETVAIAREEHVQYVMNEGFGA